MSEITDEVIVRLRQMIRDDEAGFVEFIKPLSDEDYIKVWSALSAGAVNDLAYARKAHMLMGRRVLSIWGI